MILVVHLPDDGFFLVLAGHGRVSDALIGGSGSAALAKRQICVVRELAGNQVRCHGVPLQSRIQIQLQLLILISSWRLKGFVGQWLS